MRKFTHGSSSNSPLTLEEPDATPAAALGQGSVLQPKALTPAVRRLQALRQLLSPSIPRQLIREHRRKTSHPVRWQEKQGEADTPAHAARRWPSLLPLTAVSALLTRAASALAASGSCVFVRFSILWPPVSMSHHPPSQALVLGKGRVCPLTQQLSG